MLKPSEKDPNFKSEMERYKQNPGDWGPNHSSKRQSEMVERAERAKKVKD